MVAGRTAPAVLIVDAEPHTGRVYEAKLAKERLFVTASATTAGEALRAALERPFDALLWDMRLRDTLRLLPRMRALCPNAVLILMTTDDRPILDPEISRLDVADILVKPFALETMAERLQTALAAPLSISPVARVDIAQIGQQIAIDSAAGTCVTRVLESGQDTFSVVSAPRVTTPRDFAPGLRVRVRVQARDAQYSFHAKLLRQEMEPVAQWELAMPRAIRREQRRQYPRLPVRLSVALVAPTFAENAAGREEATSGESAAERGQIMSGASVSMPTEPPPRASETGLRVSGLTEDISLGGFALVSDRALPIGAVVRFDLEKAGQSRLEGQGRVVRSQPFSPSLGGLHASPVWQYHLALQFVAPAPPFRRSLRALLESSSSS